MEDNNKSELERRGRAVVNCNNLANNKANMAVYYQVFILSNGYTIKYSKKNIKIYIKSSHTRFCLKKHHQGA